MGEEPTRNLDELAPGVPKHLGHYVLEVKIGAGGLGEVYRGDDVPLERKVAVKTLKASFTDDLDWRERFRRECQVLASLSHENLAQVFAMVEHRGRLFLVMELLTGRTVGDVIKAGTLSVRRAVSIAIGVARALEAAHSKGVLHRDVKPGNVMVGEDGSVKLVDFGLAAEVRTRPAQAMNAMAEPGRTLAGTVLGTPGYMAPEQIRREPLDARTDLFGLGAMLFEMLSGKPAFRGLGPQELMLATLHEEPDWSQLPAATPVALRELLRELLAKDRRDRPSSAGKVAADLAALPSEESLAFRIKRVAERPLARACAAALGAAGLGWGLDAQAFRGTDLAARMEKIAHRTMALEQFTKTRVAALTPETPAAELAAREGVEGFVPGDRSSMRALHGRFMQRLAALPEPPRVVVWDIMFSGELEGDAAFAAGARALREAGSAVVVGSATWHADAFGKPEVSGTILEHASWGVFNAGRTNEGGWRVDLLCRQAAGGRLLPGLALASAAAWREPTALWTFSADSDTFTVSAQGTEPGGRVPGSRRVVSRLDVQASEFFLVDSDEAFGLKEGDGIAQMAISLPDDAALDEATLMYEDVFTASADRLSVLLGGKVLMVGDMRDALDTHPHDDDRNLHGVYIHAVAVEQILHGVRLSYPSQAPHTAILLATAGLGVGAGAWGGKNARKRAIGLVCTVALIAIVCATALWIGGLMLNPILLGLTAMLGAAGLWALNRAAQP